MGGIPLRTAPSALARTASQAAIYWGSMVILEKNGNYYLGFRV